MTRVRTETQGSGCVTSAGQDPNLTWEDRKGSPSLAPLPSLVSSAASWGTQLPHGVVGRLEWEKYCRACGEVCIPSMAAY